MGLKSDFTIVLDAQGGVRVRSEIGSIADAATKAADASATAADKAATAVERAKAREIAAEQRAAEQRAKLQQQINAVFGPRPDGSASPTSTALAPPPPPAAKQIDALKQQIEFAAAAELLRSKLDPAGAAAQQYAKNIEYLGKLLAAGKITQEEHTAAVALAKKELDAVAKAHGVLGNALELNRAQFITGQSAVLRFTDSIIAGRSPLTAFALEAHKVAEVVSLDDGGVAGGLTKLRALVNPTTIALAGLAAAFIVGGKAAYDYEAALNGASRAADGYGRTSLLSGDQILESARKGAQAAGISVSAALDVETAILHQTRTSSEALEQATAISQRFADAMGTDVTDAAKALAQALGDPAKAADKLAESYGYLDSKQVEEIKSLVRANDLIGAQRVLLNDLDGQLDKTGEHVNVLTQDWRNLVSAISNGWAQIGSAIDEVEARERGAQSSAQRIKDLQGIIADDKDRLKPGFFSFLVDKSGIQAELDASEKQLSLLEKQTKAVNDRARANQLLAQARGIQGEYGLSATVSPERDKLGQQKSQLEQALAALHQQGQAGSAEYRDLQTSLAAVGHAYDTYLPKREKELAIEKARSELKLGRFNKDSAEYKAAAARLYNAEHAGEVITPEELAAGAQDRADGANVRPRKDAGASRLATLARDVAAMHATANAGFELAAAYLKSGDEALQAEAKHKSVGEAIKRQGDAATFLAAQLRIMEADEASGAAKAIRNLQDEVASRQNLNTQVLQGKLSMDDLALALQKEAVLRPLLTARAAAHGAEVENLTRIINAYVEALDHKNQVDKDSAIIEATETAKKATADIQFQIDHIQGIATLDGKLRVARDQVTRDLEKSRIAPESAIGVDRYASAAANVRAQDALERAKGTAVTNEQLRLSIDLLQRENALWKIGSSTTDDDIVALQVRNDLLKTGLDYSESEIQARIKLAQQELYAQAQLKQHQEITKDFSDIASKYIDNVFDPRKIKDFGDITKQMIEDLLLEFEKLALINPLKNLLLGSGAPTLSSGGGFGGLGGLIGSLFGGGSGGGGYQISAATALDPSSLGSFDLSSLPIPAFASGTDYAPGGAALVGERGPELVNLPRGASVIPSSTTKAMLAQAPSTHVNVPIVINAQGAGPREIDVLRSEIRQLKSDLPSTIVTTFADAQQRRVVRS